MKTYSKLNDNDLCNERISAFMTTKLPIQDRRALNAEFKKRFPRTLDNPNAKPAPDLPPWMTDETPEFPVMAKIPDWQKEPDAIRKKNLFFGKKKTTNSPD